MRWGTLACCACLAWLRGSETPAAGDTTFNPNPLMFEKRKRATTRKTSLSPKVRDGRKGRVSRHAINSSNTLSYVQERIILQARFAGGFCPLLRTTPPFVAHGLNAPPHLARLGLQLVQAL